MSNYGNVIVDSGKEYFRHLDSLRGAAALLVVFYHVNWTDHFSHNWFIDYGGIWVDFFFVLSGIVISHVYSSLGNTGDIQKFLRHRFARLYPLHILTLLAVTGAILITKAFVPGFWEVAAQKPHMQDLFFNFGLHIVFLNAHGLADSLSYNVPSWSIGAEVTAYVFYVLVVYLLPKFRNLIFSVTAIVSLIALLGAQTDITNLNFDLGFVRCLYGFSIGCLVYSIHQTFNNRKPHGIPIILATILAILYLIYRAGDLHYATSFSIPPLFGLWLFVLMRADDRVAKSLSVRPLLVLGQLSYGIYMIHFIARWAIGGMLILFTDADYSNSAINISPWLGDGLTIFYALLVVGLAQLSYLYVETPLRRKLR